MRFVSSLRYRDWRLVWSSFTVAQVGEWMDNLAVSWFVLVLTGSPLALGTVSLARGIPGLALSVVGGVVADRLNRRTVLIWARTGTMTFSAVIAFLASSDALQIWQIYLFVALRGTANAFSEPARASMIGDLVPRTEVPNAVALQSAIFNSTRIVGPALAGILIGTVGTPFVMWANVALQAAGLLTLLYVRSPTGAARRHGASAWGSLKEGMVYIWHERNVLMLMLLGIVPYILGQPYISMLPVFARDVWDIGPEGLGWLTSAASIGSLFGAFGISALGDFPRKGFAMLVGLVSFGALLIAFALMPWPHVAAIVILLAGAANQVYQTTNSSLLQVIVPTEYRGRVLGVHGMDRGFIPVGTFMAGALAEALSAPVSMSLMGGALVLFALSVMVLVPRMRRLE